MKFHRIIAVLIILITALGAYFTVVSERPGGSYRFKLGLDLSGGTHLVYRANTSGMQESDIAPGMQALRDVIERRVNLFGVSEPLVQVESSGVLSDDQKLIVELPGITNVDQAVKLIGQTPVLEFRLYNQAEADRLKAISPNATTTADKLYTYTGLTGRYLKNAELEFDQSRRPVISLVFNDEGGKLFAKITKENVGRELAIFLDNTIISSPVIREEITAGRAQISGQFDLKEAQKLVRDLNYGALPVQIELVGTQTIGAALGEKAVEASVMAGILAFIIIGLFMMAWYRLPGLVATLALFVYTVLNLLLFKLLPGPLQITLTAAGIAGFILSIGMAVDANILIFERMKEELKAGKKLEQAIHDGFARAWLSIRDSNLSSIITATILFLFASSSVIKGFALVFGIGVITSMFSAITVSRTLLFAVRPKGEGKIARFFFGNGLGKASSK